MFFEVAVPVRRIALASSLDGLNWTYERIVLSEPFNLSYPHVFQADGEYYMTPESASEGCVRLYRAANFPYQWEFVTKLVLDRPFADPTVFRYDGLWWMFVGNGASDTCWLYFSRFLDSEWTEHPMSPIVANNRGRARPAGRAVVLSDNRLFRLAQNSAPSYGYAARVFQVDVLTPTDYAEHEVAESPIVQASGSGWNAEGMHQVDPWWTGSDWLAATDGIERGTWCIGIYRTAGDPSAVSPIERRVATRMWCAPNPCRGGATLHWDGAAAPGRLAVYSPTGRLVLARTMPATATRFAWDGRTAAGEPVAAGVYFCTLERRSGTAAARIVVTR
jgi:hypothetical protein